MPKTIRAHRNGIRIGFTQPLDRTTATRPTSYEVRQWQYRWTKEYGSPEFSITDPNRIGYDRVTVAAATLSPDGRSVFLHIPTIRPVMQMEINCNAKSADGQQRSIVIHNTIHRLGGAFDPNG